MVWAVAEGLVNGVGEDRLDPSGTATRAQVAAIIMRFQQMQADAAEPVPEPETTEPEVDPVADDEDAEPAQTPDGEEETVPEA